MVGKKKTVVPKRCKTMHGTERGGWTEWVCPEPTYWMQCCDCGLIHEMEFKAFVEKPLGRGRFEIILLPRPIRPMFRMRRAKS